ncbi:MAG: FAD:protein FMN transferase [Phycisphaerales bacterium]
MLVALLASAGCAPQHEFTYRQIVMGVEARISVYAPDEAAAVASARAGFARLNELDAAMSDYRDDSELMRLCRTHGEWVAVSDDLALVLTRAQTVNAGTDGTFDVTIGPLTALWRTARREGHVPSAADIESARARSGAASLHVEPATRTARLDKPDMRLDLGGIGKGFAAQQALRATQAHGASCALVALAGDIAAGEAPPGRRGWNIAVDDFGRQAGAIDLSNASVSTSGDTEQFVELNGVRYSHVLDPSTGMGSTLRIEATVVGPDGAIVDALSSALVVRPLDEGLVWIARFPGYEARLLQRLPDGTTRVETTPRWPR